jgi:UDP-GlcNAc3NAcA epimerase
MKIASIVGARPQFIKAAVVSRILRDTPGITETVIHTGQHYDGNMSDIFFRDLQLRADYNLGVGSGLPGAQTGRMLERIEQVLLEIRADWAMVYGDTNSTLAGTLAAVKLHIPVAHVEAGLRCFDLHVPEELNRVVTDHASDLLFAPTTLAAENLLREDIHASRIFLTGDVMYDAFLQYAGRANHSGILEALPFRGQSYVLATIHRAENTDALPRLTAILEGLMDVAQDIPVVVPLHPRTRRALDQTRLLQGTVEGFHVINPVSYPDMMVLEQHARLIATDSGGVQKEAFFYRVPCVTLRARTEWEELVRMGWSLLAEPKSRDVVASAVRQALQASPPACENPYGDGHSSEKLVEILLAQLNRSTNIPTFTEKQHFALAENR